MAITIEFLSKSDRGVPILVSGVSNVQRTPIHTSITGVSQKDEIFIYANNTSSSPLTLYLQFGTTGASGTIQTTIAAKDGPMLVCPGWMLHNGLEVNAYAESGNYIALVGYVQRGP